MTCECGYRSIATSTVKGMSPDEGPLDVFCVYRRRKCWKCKKQWDTVEMRLDDSGLLPPPPPPLLKDKDPWKF